MNIKEFLKEILKCRENHEIPEKLLDILLDENSREHILQLINEKKDDKVIDVFRQNFLVILKNWRMCALALVRLPLLF